MDAKNTRRLRLVVAGGDEDFLDVVVFEFAQRDQLAPGGGDVEIGIVIRMILRGGVLDSRVLANLFRQSVRVDVAFGREDHRPLDDILQFANIAPPGILLQQLRRSGSEAGEAFSQFTIEELQQIQRNGHDVFLALAQRRNVERHNVEAVIKIFTEGARATASFRSALVAAIRRTLILIGRVPPRRMKVLSSRTRKSFACTLADMVAISSRKRVPPGARSSSPSLRRRASVKAPGSNPNNSLSSSVSGNAAQLISSSGMEARGLA